MYINHLRQSVQNVFEQYTVYMQILFDMSLVTSIQPKSLLTQMREAVADCDDGSSMGLRYT